MGKSHYTNFDAEKDYPFKRGYKIATLRLGDIVDDPAVASSQPAQVARPTLELRHLHLRRATHAQISSGFYRPT